MATDRHVITEGKDVHIKGNKNVKNAVILIF